MLSDKIGGCFDMIERNAEQDLQAWIKGSNRKPLIIRGARQVGKSTLVREFARKNKLDLIEVNLERYKLLENKFRTFNTDDILNELEAITGKTVHESSLVFLDEIQEIPSAIQSLRYFYEDKPHLPVIAAGSLLEFSLAVKNFFLVVVFAKLQS